MPATTEPLRSADRVDALLELREVGVSFRTSAGDLAVTRGVSFRIARGERIGLVGESGCGKTVTGLAIMRLLAADSARISGQVLFEGRDLVGLSAPQMRALRGAMAGM